MSRQQLDVVGLGFSSLDMVGLVPTLPELDRGVPLADITRQGGGPVAQALVTVSRLGARTGFIGRIADDEAGLVMRQQLHDEGIDLAQLQIEHEARSPECMILVHQSTGKRSICCYRGTTGAINTDLVSTQYLTSGRMLHLDGIDPDAALWAAKIARSAGIPVCLDAGGPGEGLVRLVPFVDVLIAAEAFVESYSRNANLETGARELQKLGPNVVVTTRGDQGSHTLVGTESFTTPQFSIDVVDTTGAGDVFHGAYVYGLLQGWDHPSIARFASATAALKCRKLGGRAGIPRLPEVQAFLAKNP